MERKRDPWAKVKMPGSGWAPLWPLPLVIWSQHVCAPLQLPTRETGPLSPLPGTWKASGRASGLAPTTASRPEEGLGTWEGSHHPGDTCSLPTPPARLALAGCVVSTFTPPRHGPWAPRVRILHLQKRNDIIVFAD